MKNYKILAELDLSDNSDMMRVQLDTKNFLYRYSKRKLESDEVLRIVLGNYDIYNIKGGVGLKLTIIQNTCDDLRMPRCLVQVVSTNINIKEEIRTLSRSDDIYQSLRYVNIPGEYIKIESPDASVYRYGNSVPMKIELDDLTEREEYLLTKSKTFCMYPWIHMNSSPDGVAMPCCLWDYNVKMGSVKEHTIKELWNSHNWKQLRKNMLEDQPSPGCNRCYNEEKSGFFSPRQSINKFLGHHIKKTNNTTEDGYYPDFSLVYWDIRFSNLCNLSCRSCGHIFSSSWYQDQKKLSGPEWGKKNKALFWAGKHETDMLEQLMEHIDYVEQIYFAGGEPLIMDEHYIILEELEKREKFDVKLVYNTNFTQTKLKDRYVFDYWRKFDSVSVGASLDAMGPRAEYIRKGTKWADVEENRRLMLEICPKVDFYVSATLSIQNALHLPDFHRNWVERGFIRPQDFNINLLQDPSFLRADIAPDHYKEMIRNKFEKHLEWLRPTDLLQRATQGFESAITFLNSEDRSDQLPKFWERMAKLDELRNENLLETIPELNELAK